MTKLIAEIGFNYIDDAGLCKEMVQAAKDSGAEFAKFQYFDPKYLKPGPWDTDGRREIYEKALGENFKLINRVKSLVALEKIS